MRSSSTPPTAYPEGEPPDGEEVREGQADADGEERQTGNPFVKFNFNNPSEPEDQGSE